MPIRGSTATDADALFRLQRAASVVAYAHIFPPDRYPFPDEDVARAWREAVAPGAPVVLVSHDRDEIDGVVTFTDELIERLYVHPDRWRRGIGSQLLARATDAIRAAGHARARLWVMTQNTRARRFYERAGWTDGGARRTAGFPPYPEEYGYVLDL